MNVRLTMTVEHRDALMTLLTTLAMSDDASFKDFFGSTVASHLPAIRDLADKLSDQDVYRNLPRRYRTGNPKKDRARYTRDFTDGKLE